MFTPDELINLALETLIEVEGLAPLDCTTGELICNSFKIQPLRPSRIPLYAAIHLQKRNKIKILIPREYENVTGIIEKEKEMKDEFYELPENFFEIAEILKVNNAAITELRQIRMNKIWDGLKNMDGRATYIRNCTKYEYNSIKTFITKTFRQNKAISEYKVKDVL